MNDLDFEEKIKLNKIFNKIKLTDYQISNRRSVSSWKRYNLSAKSRDS